MRRDDSPRSATAVAAEALRARREEILSSWEAAVRGLPGARVLDRAALRDDVPGILDEVEAQLSGAWGGDPASHGRQRAAQGVDVETVLAELSALRTSVIRVWSAEGALALEPLSALERALHEATAAAAHAAADVRERFFVAVDAFSRASLESRSVQELLERLLTALLGSARSADTAAILLREGDRLVVRASRGLGEDPAEAPSLGVGEGFAGRVAAEGKPLLLRDAANHPLVRRQALRRAAVRVLYGVPLRHADQIIGVAHVGSTRCGDLAPEEIRLCDAMATRAAGGVALHLARAAAETRARELALLSRVSDELAAEPELAARLERAARLAVPEFADWCALVLVEKGRLRRIAVHAADPGQSALAREMLERYPVSLEAPRGIGRVLREGVTELVSDADRGFAERVAGTDEGRVLIERLGIRSYLGVPLRSAEGVIGAFAFGMASSGRRFDERSVTIAGELARRTALAVENAQLLETSRREGRAREQLLAVVSHDLRTPLSAITVGAHRLKVLASGPSGDAARSIAEVIQRSARRMERLIGDLLDVAAIQAGRVSIHPAPQRPGELVREAVASMHGVASEHGVELEVDADPELPLVRADHDRILQVLGNLVSNALKVTPRGGRIGVRADTRGDAVRFAVTDAGPGIAAEERERIFEPFRRGAEAAYRGTGLGLAIARGLVDAHGGRIGVDGHRGAGSEFWFTLPLAVAPAR